MIWFWADPHLGHANIIKYCGRPFESKEEHDEHLIEQYNKYVSSKDQVYCLGDFGFGSAEQLRRFADRLKGNISLLKGNHDKGTKDPVFYNRFNWIKDYHLLEHKHHKVVLMHYSLRSWHFQNYGSWHLYGHSHGNLAPYGLSFDVGVDSIKKYFGDYRPISFEEVRDFMSNRQIEVDYERTKINERKNIPEMV